MIEETVLSDKMAALQVLGCLAKNPLLFTDTSYQFAADDFPDQFHKIVYGAIEHLALGGAEKIEPIDVDQYLLSYPTQYKVFCDNKGMEYILRAKAIVDENNLKYYYNILKKFSLLISLQRKGFDIKEIYNPDIVDPVEISIMQEKFQKMSIEDILVSYETKLTQIKQNFGHSEAIVEAKAGDNIENMIEKYKEAPEMGLPLISPKMTTMYHGRRLKKLYLESAAQGMGKSRRAAGEACHLAVPQYYDTKNNKWIFTGLSQPVLMISTELELEECQTMWAAYVSGVDEEHILWGKCTPDEAERVNLATSYIKKSNLYFVQISDFDEDDIVNIIRKYHFLYNVKYVFYDYLAASMKIISGMTAKSKMKDVKEYQVLNFFGQKLKILCNTLNIHIQTATQLTRDWKKNDNPDSDSLRGAYAIGDQPDVASIMLPIREKDKSVIEDYASRGFELIPNTVLSVYKNRRGKCSAIKLYAYFDRGTCRWEDCFCTNYDGEFINVTDTNIDKIMETSVVDENRFMKDLSSSIEAGSQYEV